MVRTLLIILAAASITASAQHIVKPKVLPFNPATYPSHKFRVTQNEYPYGDFVVRVIEVKNLGYSVAPRTCRAWLQVKKADQLLKQVYFDDNDMEPVGFSFGIFVPQKQPLDDYFVAVKEGDYDGRLLMVGNDGSLTNLPGGFYFLTDDKQFLIGEYATDGSSLVVVNVAQHRVVLDSSKDANASEPFDYYHDKIGYFFTDADDTSEGWVEKRNHIFRIDLTQNRIIRMPASRTTFSAAQKVNYDFDPRKMQDCNSKAQ